MICLIEKETLQNIADSVRNKIDSSQLIKVSELSSAIDSISTGSSNKIELTGDCSYRFANNGWNFIIDSCEINSKDITDLQSMFVMSTELEEINFDLNTTGNVSCQGTFNNCRKLIKAPALSCKPTNMSSIFANCFSIREINGEFDFSYLEGLTNDYFGQCNDMFSSCYSLRKVPAGFIKSGNPYANSITNYFVRGFQNCYSLDEVKLPLYFKSKWTNNVFQNTFTNCCRLKEVLFEEGKTMQWANQTIDLTTAGFGSKDKILGYNSGISEDKLVDSQMKYIELAYDKDWYATDVRFSRYNVMSAMNTIMTLPDTSEFLAQNGGTNTIKFNKLAGTGCGNPMNTLPEYYIAMAASKGWTVALV